MADRMSAAEYREMMGVGAPALAPVGVTLGHNGGPALEIGKPGYAFVIPGAPVPWKRSRHNGKRHFKDKGQEAAYTAVRDAWALTQQPQELGPLSVKLIFQFPIAKTRRTGRHKIEHGDQHLYRPDIDNLSKLILDALNEHAWTDDAQVCELKLFKLWTATEPQTLVNVRAI